MIITMWNSTMSCVTKLVRQHNSDRSQLSAAALLLGVAGQADGQAANVLPGDRTGLAR
jgi:hypothetical protein